SPGDRASRSGGGGACDGAGGTRIRRSAPRNSERLRRRSSRSERSGRVHGWWRPPSLRARHHARFSRSDPFLHRVPLYLLDRSHLTVMRRTGVLLGRVNYYESFTITRPATMTKLARVGPPGSAPRGNAA